MLQYVRRYVYMVLFTLFLCAFVLIAVYAIERDSKY